MDVSQVTRPADTQIVSDVTVINDVIENWLDVERETHSDVSFPEAVRSHLDELRTLLTSSKDNDTFATSLRTQIAIIEGWLAEFADMHARLSEL